jgi:hypothetical protein
VSTRGGTTEADAARLLEPRPGLGVPVPAFDGRSLPNVTSSVVRAAGVEIEGAPGQLPPLAPDIDPFDGRRAEGPIVVLLVDALGWPGFGSREALEGAGYPPPWLERARPITTVFPTTTTVALTSLSTGASPSQHGIAGHRLYLPSYGMVAEILRMAPNGMSPVDALAGPNWAPSMLSGVPSVFRRGLATTALSRDKFESTAFTRMIYDGATFVGYSTAPDFAFHLAELLDRPRPPSVIFAYWDDLDTVGHLRGPEVEFDAFEAAHVRGMLQLARRRLPSDLARRTTVLITGDHGQVRATPESEVALDRVPEVASLLSRPPTGDRRAGFLSARQGRVDELTQGLERILPAGRRILPMSRAVELGMFGPPPYHPELSERLGDLLVLVPAPASLTYHLPGAPARKRFLRGGHGGIDPEELLIPLIAGGLAEL